MMAEGDPGRREEQDGGGVAVEEGRPKLKEPARFAVILHNDDYTTFDFVVEVLTRFFRKTMEEAAQITMKVHHEGHGLAGVFTHDIAETKVVQVTEYAQTMASRSRHGGARLAVFLQARALCAGFAGVHDLRRFRMIGRKAEAVLNRSSVTRSSRNHEYFTLEHVLWSLLDEIDVIDTVRGAGGDPSELRKSLEKHLETRCRRRPATATRPSPSIPSPP